MTINMTGYSKSKVRRFQMMTSLDRQPREILLRFKEKKKRRNRPTIKLTLLKSERRIEQILGLRL